MRALGVLVVTVLALAVACGGRTTLFELSALEEGREGGPGPTKGAGAGDAATAPSDGEASDGDLGDGEGTRPPVPTCTGENSQCIDGPHGWVGAAVIMCDPADWVGPWTLLLQRGVNGQFQTVQVQVVQTPGFGATFDDQSSPANAVTYQVCVVDALGTRCGPPFTTSGPPGCACEPVTCVELQACEISTSDGCGGTVECGPCNQGATCNLGHNCCPAGTEPNGTGDCVCAPPFPCTGRTYWDPSMCSCSSPG